MKKLFVALMLMPLMAFAETETVDGIAWTYTIIDGKAQIGTGSSCAIPIETAGVITIPSDFGGVPVTSIGDFAFHFCRELTSVTIPEGVKNIGHYAFENCSKLMSVMIPSSMMNIGGLAFEGCSGLKVFAVHDDNPIYRSAGGMLFSKDGKTLLVGINGDVTVPDGVTCIGEYAFFGRYGLTSVTIPSSVTRIGDYAFANCGIKEVRVSDLSSFGRIDFADYSSNPVSFNTELYANGILVEGTVRVTFKLEDDWMAAFREIVDGDAATYEGYVSEKTIEVVKGHPAYPPEVIMWDKRFEICAWDIDLCCVMSDTVARPIYGGADINEALRSCISPYGSWIDDLEIVKELNDSCFVDRLVFDAVSGCVRAQGTFSLQDHLYQLEDSNVYGALDENLSHNLRIRLIGRDEHGDEVCYIDTARYYVGSDLEYAWSGALPIDTNRVRRIDVALASTWYREEFCFRTIPITDIDCRMLAVRKIDFADLRDADYELIGKRTENHDYSYSKRRENTVTYYDYKRVVEGEKCEAVYEFSDREELCNPYDIRSSGIVSFNGMNIDLSGGSFSWITDYDSLSCVTNLVRLQVQREWTDKSDWQVDRFSWEEHTYSTLFIVAPQKYSVRFDLAGCGIRVGGGELVQEIDSGKGENEESPIVEAYPHCTFLRWAQPYWNGNTLVYVAEYKQEYVITNHDISVDAFAGAYDGAEHGITVSVPKISGAVVTYGLTEDGISLAQSPTFTDAGEHDVFFRISAPECRDYVGTATVTIDRLSIERAEVTLGAPLVYTGSVQTQAVSSVIVDGLAATYEVVDNEACEAGAYQLTVSGVGNFCGTLSVPFAVAKAQASVKDVVVEGVSSETGVVEFTYDGKPHLPVVVARYDGSAVVRFSLSEEGPYADELNVSNAVERLDVWYEIDSVNYARLVGRTQMAVRPLSIADAEVVLGEQVSDAEGHVVQLVDSVIVNGLSATFIVTDNVATAEGDFELTVTGVGNFTGEAKCSYSVGGIVLPPLMTPGDGTVFTNAQTVRFSVQTPGSKCYYTLDGSMPTTNSLNAGRVNLHEKTTIRAIAVLDGKLRSAVVEARYALGACENPRVRLEGHEGFGFHFPGQLVVIDKVGDEGVVHYTLDGSEPTVKSPAYEGPFAISVSTTVKAKVFSDTFFDSETVTADMRFEPMRVPTPVIQAESEYCGTHTTVSLTCALEGAVIRYTLDGSEPTSASTRYVEAFEIGGVLGSSIPVKARAFRDLYEDSPVAEVVVTRVWGIGDTLGVPDMTFETEGWVVDPLETFEGRQSMRSGPADDGETRTLEAVVHGGGALSFGWRTSCEDSDGDFIWDRAEFWVDGECIAKLEGESEWAVVSHVIQDDDCDHCLRWLYVKDPEPETSEGRDCAWLSQVNWLPCGNTIARPTVEGDPGAMVTGDVETGFVIRPSEGKTVVEVSIPVGIDAGRITVEVSVKVARVKPNGANVKIVSGVADITEFLNVPAADGDGVIDLTKATVKQEIVNEVMDPKKGAKIVLDATNPSLTTSNTREGLLYKLREGTTIGGMNDGDSKVGDGKPWSPKITVKGGNSAFYSIGVGKGE